MQMFGKDEMDLTEVTLKISRNTSRFRVLVGSPGSKHRIAWDLIGGALIIYDLIVIPLSVFRPAANALTIFMDWFTLVFWTINMPMSTLQGYVKDGLIVMDFHKICLHYIKTWFAVDLAVVGPDWVFTLLTASTGAQSDKGRYVRLLRVLRLSRTLRLVRLLKLGWIIRSINDRLNSEYASIVANIVQMILALLASNHFIACTWYLIADMSIGSKTWVTVHGFQNEEWKYLYMTAFHWSITQFTPASMHVQPQNMAERTFAVMVVVLALVGFSYLVGSITGSLAQLRGMGAEKVNSFWALRRFLRHNSVPMMLSIRITRFLEHAWQRHKCGRSEESVKILSLLSDQLLSELRCALIVKHLVVHPLMEHLNEFLSVSMQRVASSAISRKHLARGDTLFIPTEVGRHMYFVATGRLRYIRVAGQGEEVQEWVDRDEDWISEPVIWISAWFHVGKALAFTESDILMLSPTEFGTAILLNPMAVDLMRSYAGHYIEWLNRVEDDCLTDVTQGEYESSTFRGFMEGPEDGSLMRSTFGQSGRSNVKSRLRLTTDLQSSFHPTARFRTGCIS